MTVIGIDNDETKINKVDTDLVTTESIDVAEKEIKAGKVRAFKSISEFARFIKNL